MNKYCYLEAIGAVDEKFLEEVFEDNNSSNRITAAVKRIAAIAACAVLIMGAWTVVNGRPTEVQTEPEIPEPKPQVTTVEVDQSFVGIDGEQLPEEEVKIISYFEEPIDCQGYRYVMKKVEYSKAIPDYILKEDIIWRLGVDMDTLDEKMKETYPYKHEPGDGTLVVEHLDENGRYSGKSERTWVFVTLEMTNLSDEEDKHDIYWHYIEYSRPKNDWHLWFRKVTVIPGEEFPEEVTADYYHHEFPTEIAFAPNETKTVIFGYLIESDFIYDSPEICLGPKDPDRASIPNDDTKLHLR